MRLRGKVDAGQRAIVRALRDAGRRVFVASSVGGGFPDLVVHWGGKVAFLEVKSPGGTLTPAQEIFHRDWAGPRLAVVSSVSEALAATGLWVSTRL